MIDISRDAGYPAWCVPTWYAYRYVTESGHIGHFSQDSVLHYNFQYSRPTLVAEPRDPFLIQWRVRQRRQPTPTDLLDFPRGILLKFNVPNRPVHTIENTHNLRIAIQDLLIGLRPEMNRLLNPDGVSFAIELNERGRIVIIVQPLGAIVHVERSELFTKLGFPDSDLTFTDRTIGRGLIDHINVQYSEQIVNIEPNNNTFTHDAFPCDIYELPPKPATPRAATDAPYQENGVTWNTRVGPGERTWCLPTWYAYRYIAHDIVGPWSAFGDVHISDRYRDPVVQGDPVGGPLYNIEWLVRTLRPPTVTSHIYLQPGPDCTISMNFENEPTRTMTTQSNIYIDFGAGLGYVQTAMALVLQSPIELKFVQGAIIVDLERETRTLIMQDNKVFQKLGFGIGPYRFPPGITRNFAPILYTPPVYDYATQMGEERFIDENITCTTIQRPDAPPSFSGFAIEFP